MKKFVSDLSKREFPLSEKISGRLIRQSIFSLMKSEHPDLTKNSVFSVSELKEYSEKYIANFLSKQVGELSELEQNVVRSMTDNTTIVNDEDDDDEQNTTLGQRVADKVAVFGGSWTFIILFSGFLLLWIFVNIVLLLNKGFDPYPFILLNLILSCIAAMQAPIIMMSQNRQEEKDRERAKKDYMVNLKAELELRMLHEKIDHLLIHQQQELLEVQKIQIATMNSILSSLENSQQK